MAKRMIEITFTHLIDVTANSAKEAEGIAEDLMQSWTPEDYANCTSYRIVDHGVGGWDD